MAESARLEIVCGETHRGFESHPLRRCRKHKTVLGRDCAWPRLCLADGGIACPSVAQAGGYPALPVFPG